MRIVQEISRKLQHGLAIQSFVNLLRRFGLFITPFYLHLEGTFDHELQSPTHGFDEYAIGFLGPEDMREIAEIPSRKISEEVLLARLGEGKKCFGAKYHGKLAAFTWCNFESCSDPIYRFKLKDNEVYLFDAYTLESFRGKNIAPYLRFKCYEALKALGRNNFYSLSLYFNKPAIKFKKKLNARPLILGLYINVLGRWDRTWKIKKYCYPK